MIVDLEVLREIVKDARTLREIVVRLDSGCNNTRNRRRVWALILEHGLDAPCLKPYETRRSPGDKNERICPECGKLFIAERNSRKFCSHSCACSFNNRKSPKRRTKYRCQQCGGPVTSGSFHCQSCISAKKFESFESRPIREVSLSGDARLKFISIRKGAIKKLARSGRPKQCQICGFTLVVEVHHIIPISKFPETALVGEVNSLQNLVYLCPNHHAMAERGMLKNVLSTGVEPASED